MLDHVSQNEVITNAWERLSPEEQSEAEELVEAPATVEMEVPLLF
jgi:hypothetical protein